MNTCFFFFMIMVYGGTLFVNSETDSCGSNLNLGNLAPFDTSSLNCLAVWTTQDFILRYAQSAADIWSFVVSTPDSNSYIAMGFSSNGMMVGSSAVVGWISAYGGAAIQRYSLEGKEPRQVVPDQGTLQIPTTSRMVTSQSGRLFMAFQLNTTQPDSHLLYAVGPTGVLPPEHTYVLSQHIDSISTTINFVTGEAAVKNPNASLRRSHGALNMLGWGILMIIGAIIARHFKELDPIWFYSHVLIQLCGFIIGVAGIICGFVLNNRLRANVSTHKGLGIFILVLGCLQVMAFLVRPDKGSKLRKFWNWYHYSVGRILIIFAIANVFYGIHLGEKGNGWKAGYGVVIAILLTIAAALEFRRTWMRK